MALVLNEEQGMLRDAAREFCSKNSPVSALRKLRDENSSDGFDRAVWQHMVELGWAGILVPEQYGGFEFGFQGMGVVMEECGRNLVASPLLSTSVLCASALNITASEEQKVALLPKIASGTLLMALAIEESAHHAPFTTACKAKRDGKDGGTWLLSGRKCFVLDGHIADKLIVTADTGSDADADRLALFLVDTKSPGLRVERTQMVDSRNAANIVLHDVSAELVGEPGTGKATIERVLDIACAALSAEMLGTAREAFERTLAYLKEREQFGVPIGSFQALKHRAAEMFNELELSQSAVMALLTAIDEGSEESPALASLAKSRLCDTLNLVTSEAVQMFGGIGMTDEHEIGFFIKRARVCEQSFGNSSYHRNRYGLLGGY